MDPDVNSSDALNFAATEPISAVDKNGKQVVDNEIFKDFFSVDRSIILPFSLANFRNGSVNTMCIKSLSYLMRFRAHGRLFCQNAFHCKVHMYSWTQLVYFTSSGGMFF